MSGGSGAGKLRKSQPKKTKKVNWLPRKKRIEEDAFLNEGNPLAAVFFRPGDSLRT